MNRTSPPDSVLPANRICEQARLARDPRFDGRFFTAVLTTGIYCRPVCPAPAPKEKNVRYFATSSEAFAAGFRPCLRCRPESAPKSPAWLGTETTVRRALSLLDSTSGHDCSIEVLAERLGISDRHLRRLFRQYLGVNPQDYLQYRNLLFAKKLLAETRLPILDVAVASGFNSRRRFNAAFREKLQLAPSDIRKSQQDIPPSEGCSLRLQYRPPYQWETMLDFYRNRCIDGIERVTNSSYARSFSINGTIGWYEVSQMPAENALLVNIHSADTGQLQNLVTMIRAQFDIDANPDLIDAKLGRQAVLKQIVRKLPGLRIPGIISEFEAVIRAIAGQQISVKAARTLLGRLCRRCSPQAQTTPPTAIPFLLFPGPQDTLAQDLAGLGFTGKRIGWIKEIARQYADGFTARAGDLETSVERLQSLPGIGAWSAHYIAMRALGEPDAFPTADLGLLNALRNPERPSARELEAMAEHWRPWRAYATLYLWHTL
jgi:AraC family transcriptional regulator of adaptative response / DNA-3-methyladenine glycosylase II